MKEKSVDIALDVQSRMIFFQRARGANVYIIAGWRNQHTTARIGLPHIKPLKYLKVKRVGISDFNSIRRWGIQIQLRKACLERMPFPSTAWQPVSRICWARKF